eukprot:TRINITY_DN2159_c0_g1_i3.p2 TRINITY_DN2159_c0_g1~~TRINITY_DN2159_c0_g1_i3.p2  ORF type:complete len:110 (-),score=10.06 TRINITY_DN2159_c0_g1_i3:370-699(-)
MCIRDRYQRRVRGTRAHSTPYAIQGPYTGAPAALSLREHPRWFSPRSENPNKAAIRCETRHPCGYVGESPPRDRAPRVCCALSPCETINSRQHVRHRVWAVSMSVWADH